MPASRLSAQEYIQQLRAQRNQKQEAVTTPPPDATTTPEAAPSKNTPSATESVPTTPTTNSATSTDTPPATPSPLNPSVEKVVLEWEAPNRPYKKRDRRYYLTVGTIVFLICLILFFAGQFLPIAVVISVAFLAYVLSAVPPVIVKHQLTNYGLRIDDELYLWTELGRFWITKKFNQEVINLEVDHFPWRLTVLLGDKPADKMAEMFGAILIQETPQPTAYEKGAAWLQKMIPLDSE